MTDQAVIELAPRIGVRQACDAVGVAQAGYYRRHRLCPAPARPAPTPQPRAGAATGAQPRRAPSDPGRTAQRPLRGHVSGRGLGHAAG